MRHNPPSRRSPPSSLPGYRGVGWVSLGLAAVCALAAPAEAQELTERTPNLSGGWVGETGSAHFHLLHRFWGTGGRNIANSPTMTLALPLPGDLLVGGQFGSNSGIAGEANEAEAFLRWATPTPWQLPLAPSLTAAYNSAAGSADGELLVAVDLDRARLLGAARAFSDALGSGSGGWSAAGGLVLDVSEHVAVAGDYGTAWVDGDRRRAIWGAGVHLRIPTTPHSLSVQVTNTPTATLHGSSFRVRRGKPSWGFEFTIPITFARYRSRAPATAEVVPADRGVREVTMTDDLRFTPEVVEIHAGETVTWRNTTSVPHTVTAHADRVRDETQVSLPDGAEPFDSGSMAPGAEFRHTFTVPGEYVYVCVPHDAAPMIGVIRVLP